MKEYLALTGRFFRRGRFFARPATPAWLASVTLVWLAAGMQAQAAPVFTVRAAGHEGFDVFADGVLVAPIRLAANGVILADTITTNGDGLTLSALHASDPLAVSFAPGDFVRIIVPPPGQTNSTGATVPTVQFRLTVASFNTNRWLALFPQGAAPFHFLVCAMPSAQVWHQRGWLNATPVADPFPLLQDVHNGTPQVSCSWNRNWSYICPLGGQPIPMIGLWDPSAGLYVGYDFQGARASDQSARYLATAYCWGQGALTNFIALAYPYGGNRYEQQVFPQGGEVLASWFDLQIDTDLPATEDPNERFQARLFQRYTNSLPPVPAMNDLGWIPGGSRLADFAGPIGLNLYGVGNETTFYPTGTVLMFGWQGHREMPIDTAVHRSQWSSITSARGQIETLLTNYAISVTVDGESCLFWEKPLAGAWKSNWGGPAATTMHQTDGWFAARVLVELYRYDRSQNQVRPSYLPAIDSLFNWAKHFVWSRNEFADVPSSPFAIGATLCPSFLLDYYFTFRNDAQRAANATLALHLANTITWRYLHPWAMDSDRFDGAVDSAFLIEPNSGQNWAGLGCANEVNWNIDALTQVYVHTGDPRMRYYLRGILQRWPALYQPVYEDSISAYSSSAFTEGLGVFDGSGPGRGLRYGYGSCPKLALEEPVGASTMRVVGGAAACIAFNKGSSACDVAEYRTGGDGSCSFRIVSSLGKPFDVSFSYPFVDISALPVTRVRNGQTNVLAPPSIVHPYQEPSSLYLSQLQDGDRITIGSVPAAAPVITFDNSLVYNETNLRPHTNGLFRTLPFTGEYPLPQSWTNLDSFAGIVPGERWSYGVPYHQSLSGRTNDFACPAPGATAVLAAYVAPPLETLTHRPSLLLDDGSQLALSGHPAPAWRGWPIIFPWKVLLDYAVLPAGRSLAQIQPSGTMVMAVTAFTGSPAAWLPIQTNLLAASATFVKQELMDQAVLALQASYAQLPDGKIVLLPLNTAGAGANFAAATGLRKKWVALTEAQYVDTNYFTASRFPMAFYLGNEHYLKTVNTVGDGKTAITNYLASGGTIVILATGPFPFYYGDGPGDAPGPADPLLPTIGMPFKISFETAPPGIYMLRYTNQGMLHSVPNEFAFPPGDQRLRSINRTSVSSSHRYVPLIKALDTSGNDYGDAAVFIVFGSGTAKNGRIVYVWSTLLSGPEGQPIMIDVVTWILDAVLRPPLPRLNLLPRSDSAHFAFEFEAGSNLYYSVQSRTSLGLGWWSTVQNFASALANRSVAVTNSVNGTSGFYRVAVGP